MRIKVDIVGSMQRMMAAEIRAGEVAVTRGVAQGGSRLQKGWREQVTSSGLGARLARTVRQQNYPVGDVSMGAASLVYARPNKKPGSASAADLMDAFDRGVTIRSQNDFWLAIPLPAAGRQASRGGRGDKRLSPLVWEERTGRKLKFIFRKGRPSLLVDTGENRERSYTDPLSYTAGRRRGGRKNLWIPVFILVPQVRLKKRLNIERLAREAEASLPGLILSNWKEPT